ncbi:hypothetical protein ACU61A_00710 [Pseudonocardia sichuanensis]
MMAETALYATTGFTGDAPEVRVSALGEHVHVGLGGMALTILLEPDTARELAEKLLAALDGAP